MSRTHALSARLRRVLERLDERRYGIVCRKIASIIGTSDLDHYKNLRAPLQRYKRVHIDGNLVLLFRVEGDCVMFEDLAHHDRVYVR